MARHAPAPVPTMAPETSMVQPNADRNADTVNICLTLRLNFSYPSNIYDLRIPYVAFVAVLVCLFVAVAVYQTVMKALMIALVVVAMVTFSTLLYMIYEYMNNKVKLTTQYNIVKYLTKGQLGQDQSSEIHGAASVVNIGNIDSEISRQGETLQRHTETGTNEQDDKESKGSTDVSPSNVVNNVPVTITRVEDDSSPEEDDLTTDNPFPDRAQLTPWPLYRSPQFHLQQTQRISQSQMQPSIVMPVSQLLETPRQGEFQQNNFISQFIQQLAEIEWSDPTFGFLSGRDSRAVVRASHSTGSGSMVVRRRALAGAGGPYLNQDVMKPYFNFIADKMPADWKQLATNLDLPFAQVLAVNDRHRDCWMCCHQVMEMWRSNNGAQATVDDLIKAVRDTGKQDVAEELESMQLD
ncbi:uncharacterized protein LOC144867765 [Branchiostoma floridae x Branchiostoma japonicum]